MRECEHHPLSAWLTVNLTTWLIFWQFKCLSRLKEWFHFDISLSAVIFLLFWMSVLDCEYEWLSECEWVTGSFVQLLLRSGGARWIGMMGRNVGQVEGRGGGGGGGGCTLSECMWVGGLSAWVSGWVSVIVCDWVSVNVHRWTSVNGWQAEWVSEAACFTWQNNKD